MTRDSDGGRAQKTVAELLAEHGGQVGGTPRRRRRRAAEDDDAPGGRQPRIGDTAPQAIIDRVRAESPPPGVRREGRAPDQPPSGTGRSHGAPPRPPQNSGGHRVPSPEDGARPQQTSGGHRVPRPEDRRPPQNSGGYRVPPTENGPRPPQNSGGNRVPSPEEGARPQQTSGGHRVPLPEDVQRPPLPPRAPDRRPPNGSAPGVARPPGPLGGPPRQGGPGGPPPQDTNNRMTATRRVAPAVPPTPPHTPPLPPPPHNGSLASRLDGADDTVEPDGAERSGYATAVRPPQGTGAFPPPGRRRPPRGAPPPPPEPSTEQFAAVAEPPAEVGGLAQVLEPDEPPAGLADWYRHRDGRTDDTQVAPALADDEDSDEGPATGYYVPDFDDDSDDEGGRSRTGVLDDDPLAASDDYPGDTGTASDDGDDSDEAEEPSPARQWLGLAGQLALGVVGGAGVWLAFNWLWGKLPAAALIAALVVTMGLVWIVRKVRRAEDLQTTVIALLVGLVVTVSPAALLLVSR